MSTFQAIAFRRNQLRRVREAFPEIERPGVYLLIGTDENEPDRLIAYIGESEGIGSRLYTHNSNDAGRDPKAYWTDTLWTVHAVHRTQANVVPRRETLFLANQQVTGIFMPADLCGSTTPKTGMTVADIPMDRCLPETLSCLITSIPIQKSCSIDTDEVRT